MLGLKLLLPRSFASMVATPLDGRCYTIRSPILLYRYMPAMENWCVTVPIVAVWYRCGQL